MNAVALALLVCLMLFFGCASGPSISSTSKNGSDYVQPAGASNEIGNTPQAISGNGTAPAPGENKSQQRPADSEVPYQQPSPPQDNITQQPPSPPKDNGTKQLPPLPQLPSLPSLPTSKIYEHKNLKVGETLDFGEGSVTLDDVWIYSSVLPAVVTIKDPQGALVKQRQAVPGLEIQYLSPGGRRFWMYVSSTDAGYDIYVKRASVFVLEAREGAGASFDKKLYPELAANEAIATLNKSRAFGSPVSDGAINRSGRLDAKGWLSVGLDDLRRYPEGSNPALVSIYDGPSVSALASIPPGHAYAHQPQDGGKYMVYYEGGGAGKITGETWANFRIYEAGSAIVDGRTYKVENASALPIQNYSVGKLDLRNDAETDTGRDFYLRLLDCGSTSYGNDFVLAESLDEDYVQTDFGIIQASSPFYAKDKYGRPYSFWLDFSNCASTGATARVSMYRER